MTLAEWKKPRTLAGCKERTGWTNLITEILDRIQNRLKERVQGDFRLTKLQQIAIDTDGFWRDWTNESSQNLMIQGATSAGKTLLAELAILDTLANSKSAIILVPLKSMVHERWKQFKDDIGYDFNVYAASSDYMEYDERLIEGDYNVAVIVYEKFFSMLSQDNQKIMKNCGLIVVDELSMLSKEQRGPKLEMALEVARRNYPAARIICLATSDCSTIHVCKWLGIDDGSHKIFSAARPVALEEHILNLDGSGQWRTIPADCEILVHDDFQREQLSIPGYQKEWKLREKKEQLLQALLKKLMNTGDNLRILIFVASKSEAENVAGFLKEKMGNHFSAPDLQKGGEEHFDNFLQDLKNCDEDQEQASFIQSLVSNGIAFHHAGLSTTLREKIEEEFQHPNSSIRVIVATETLTVGVNMPFDVMIMMSSYVPRGEGEEIRLTQQEYRNYIGRAGRLSQSKNTGITYLLLDNRSDFVYFWNSLSQREEIQSALTGADEKTLAPYYLGFLIRKGIKFTEQDISDFYEHSLSKLGNSRSEISTKKLCDALYDSYLADNGTKGAGRGISADTKEYKVESFGSHMAPYALLTDTCIKIYDYFYFGTEPGSVSSKDINSDRYLLDILYHVCLHEEIENMSVLTYPKDNRNPSRRWRMKQAVINQIKNILSETTADGNEKYAFWPSAQSNDKDDGEVDRNDLDRLKNEVNLGGEDYIVQASLRAILLFWWTMGKTIRDIKRITGLGADMKLVSGDIERLAEVASFHIDAIAKSISTNTLHFTDPQIYNSLYSLQCRVKYGMPQDLIRLANKHIHGLDRNRLLSLRKDAQDRGMTPLVCLYCDTTIAEKHLTHSQRNSLMAALERRGEMNKFDARLELLDKDAGMQLTPEQRNGIEQLYNFEDMDAGALFETIRAVVQNNELLPNTRVVTYGEKYELLWEASQETIYIGVLSNVKDFDKNSFNKFFADAESNKFTKLLLVSRSEENEDNCSWKERLEEMGTAFECETVFDNQFFALILAHTMLKSLKHVDSLVAFMKDARGIFTVDEDRYYSPENYIGDFSSTSDAELSVLYSKNRLVYTNHNIDISEFETQIEKQHKCRVLPWGNDLTELEDNLLTEPIVLLLEREMIVRSKSLRCFVTKLQENNFYNTLLILSSEDAQKRWNEGNSLESRGECNWCKDFCGIYQIVCHDTNSAAKEALKYLTRKPECFIIGVSYAHDDTYSLEDRNIYKSPNDLLEEVLTELTDPKGDWKFRKCQILYDQYMPAKKLFGQNRGKKKSLEAYRNCKVCLILWNNISNNNDNCKEEREAIFDSNVRYFYLCPTDAPDVPLPPDVPKEDFSEKLNENNIRIIAEKVEKAVREELEKEHR